MYINIWTQLAKLMRKVNKRDVQEFIPFLDLQSSEIWWNIEISPWFKSEW